MLLSNGKGSNYHSIPERLRHQLFQSYSDASFLPPVQKSVSSYLDSVFLLLPNLYLIDLTSLESSTLPANSLFPPLDCESSLHPPIESLISLIQGRSDLLLLEFLQNGPLPGPLQIKSKGKQPHNLDQKLNSSSWQKNHYFLKIHTKFKQQHQK